MSGRESLIATGLAVVLVVGIIDAAADQGSPKSTPAGAPPTTAATPVTTETPSSIATPSARPGQRKHRHRGGAVSTTAPTTPPATAASSQASSPAPRPAATSSASEVPEGVLGTFTYATTGGEGTNLPGTQRSFPKTTTIKNKLEGCGVSSTWKPIPEHVQKQLLCAASDGIKIKAYQTMISFYGVSSGEDFKCSGPSYVDRRSVAPGDTWTFKCKSPDATAVQTAKAIGFQTIEVGGTAVRTLHVHVDTKLHGNDSGTSSQDYWIDTNKPVLVKESGKVTATQQNVHYSSSYSLALKSLSPKT